MAAAAQRSANLRSVAKVSQANALNKIPAERISMSYKTVLVHVDQSRQAPVRMAVAADIAKSHQAHLVGAAMTGISRYGFDRD